MHQTVEMPLYSCDRPSEVIQSCSCIQQLAPISQDIGNDVALRDLTVHYSEFFPVRKRFCIRRQTLEFTSP